VKAAMRADREERMVPERRGEEVGGGDGERTESS